METTLKPPRTGMEAFELMPEGTYCQLINDAIIMSPAPTTPHARVQNEIFVQIYDYVKRYRLGEAFCAPVDVFLNETNVYQPDIFFVEKEKAQSIKRKGIYTAPSLVIEILSGDRKYDLVEKKKVYEVAGVKEYWVVDPENKCCEGFTLENGEFKPSGESTGELSIRLFELAIIF